MNRRSPPSPESTALAAAGRDDAPAGPEWADSNWTDGESFCTQLQFALERPAPPTTRPARAAGSAAASGGLDQANSIAGSYTVSYNARSGLLALSGTLKVDGATYFIDDQLTIDRSESFDAYLCAASAGGAGDAQGRRLTAWSAGGLPTQGPALQLLASLAVMGHLGLKRPVD